MNILSQKSRTWLGSWWSWVSKTWSCWSIERQDPDRQKHDSMRESWETQTKQKTKKWRNWGSPFWCRLCPPVPPRWSGCRPSPALEECDYFGSGEGNYQDLIDCLVDDQNGDDDHNDNFDDDDKLPVEVETVYGCLERDSAAVYTRTKDEESPNFL